MSNPQSFDNFINVFRYYFGTADILINNAGINYNGGVNDEVLAR